MTTVQEHLDCFQQRLARIGMTYQCGCPVVALSSMIGLIRAYCAVHHLPLSVLSAEERISAAVAAEREACAKVADAIAAAIRARKDQP